MHSCVIALAAAIAIGPLMAKPAVAQERKPLFPTVVDSTHATANAVRFFDSFFTAKSRHDVSATMDHFSGAKLTYIAATLGWPFYSYEALREVFAQYMPKWPPSGLSYPTRILGNVATLLSNDVIYEDMTLRTQVLGKLAVERYFDRALRRLPAGEGSSVLHIVGSDMGGGYEWEAGPAYRTTVRRGITAVTLDRDGLISRLTTVWDGAVIPDADVRALTALSLD